MPSKNSVNRAKIINTAHARQQANALRRRRHSDKALRSGIVFGKCDSKKTIRKKLRNSAYALERVIDGTLASEKAGEAREDGDGEVVMRDLIDLKTPNYKSKTLHAIQDLKQKQKQKRETETETGQDDKMEMTTIGRGTELGAP